MDAVDRGGDSHIAQRFVPSGMGAEGLFCSILMWWLCLHPEWPLVGSCLSLSTCPAWCIIHPVLKDRCICIFRRRREGASYSVSQVRGARGGLGLSVHCCSLSLQQSDSKGLPVSYLALLPRLPVALEFRAPRNKVSKRAAVSSYFINSPAGLAVVVQR